MIHGKSPEEVAQFVDKQASEAESLGGMALSDTCKKLHNERMGLKSQQPPAWMSKVSMMCAKMDRMRKPMRGSDLVQRCRMMDDLKKKGSARLIHMRQKKWFAELMKICSHIGHDGAHAEGSEDTIE